VANIATSLEMLAPPSRNGARSAPADFALRAFDRADHAGYLALFRRIGQDWLWTSRLAMAERDLREILENPQVEIMAAERRGEPVGLLELDFREPDACELAYFGLVPEAFGLGAGRWLMSEAVTRAWARPIRRLWVHTCTFDHPKALAFYLRSGFRPFAFMVEVFDDPRLTGLLPRHVAPHVPLIELAVKTG